VDGAGVTLKTLPLADLVEDYDVYPRHALDTGHVRKLEEALRSGNALPPIVVARKGNRIVDGFHRKRAYIKVLGPTGQVEVDVRGYASEVELVRDAITMNAAHGRGLDEQDRTKGALMLRRLGVETADIAVVLHTTPERIDKILVRVVEVRDEYGTHVEPAKPVVRRFGTPRTLSPQQQQVHRSSSGWRPAQTVTQLTREIESGVLDVTAEGMRERLWRLAEVITATVGTRPGT
jgi:hypothetical protein